MTSKELRCKTETKVLNKINDLLNENELDYYRLKQLGKLLAQVKRNQKH